MTYFLSIIGYTIAFAFLYLLASRIITKLVELHYHSTRYLIDWALPVLGAVVVALLYAGLATFAHYHPIN